MTESDTPKPTGKAPQSISLTGCLIPWGSDNQPVFLGMPGSPYLYLPTFSSEGQLRSVMSRAAVVFEKIKHIEDGNEFLASIPHEIVVIKDPRFTMEGRVRFMQVLRD